MSNPKVRRAFQVNSHFKTAFVAGMKHGAALERNGMPPALMAAVDQVGDRAFANMFTDSILDPATSAEVETFFDDFWKEVLLPAVKGE